MFFIGTGWLGDGVTNMSLISIKAILLFLNNHPVGETPTPLLARRGLSR
jgi:hypothetical protein